MKKILTFLSALFCLACTVCAQQDSTSASSANKTAVSIPQEETQSAESIAAYINTHYATPQERLKAIYSWIAENIAYDIAKATSMEAITEYDKEKAIQTTLNTRKGVCQDYSELMETLCKGCGIDVFLIPGFVLKPNQELEEPHAWIITGINNEWQIHDPTWGAGYVNNDVFTKRLSFDYFNIPPPTSITSRMPTDPMWQLLTYPISVQEYYSKVFEQDSTKPFFNYPDTIAAYRKLNTVGQCHATLRRIETAGIYNQATADYVMYLKNEIENDKINYFNAGIYHFNAAVAAINTYVAYFNTQFTPELPKEEVLNILYTVEQEIEATNMEFESVKNPSPDMAQQMNTILSNMNELLKKAKEGRAFTEKYYNTGKLGRPFLFQSSR